MNTEERQVNQTEIVAIRAFIIEQRAKIVATEEELAEAKRIGDKDAISEIRSLLVEQQKVKNILLIN